MEFLYNKLIQYQKNDYYPMHMPGHKRNVCLMPQFNPYSIDITEIDGFDNLHHAEDILQDLMKRISNLYHSQQSYVLVNGSTVGLLAGIHACTKKGDRVIVARNSHKAVYHAIELNELQPVYVYPQVLKKYGINGGILPSEIEKLLITYPDTKLIVITSPTYEGIVSDIAQIASIAHKYGVTLLVDEAHGAHLGFSSQFPTNSIQGGADIVIQSIHKTLPAFTQTAVLHVNSSRVAINKVEKYLSMYESSSPSYILLAGVDACIQLLENDREKLFELHSRKLEWFYKETAKLNFLDVMNKYKIKNGQKRIDDLAVFDVDPSKVLISVKNTNISGNELHSILLKDYKIQIEMSSFDYVLAMTSIADSEQGYERLIQALLEIDSKLFLKTNTIDYNFHIECEPPKQVYLPHEILDYETVQVDINECENEIAADYVSLYPPGIPVVVPGERLSKCVLSLLTNASCHSLEVIGLSHGKLNIIRG